MLNIESLPDILSYNAKHNADSLCIKCETREYTYKEIDEITNGIALFLLNRGVVCGNPVGLYGSRTELIPIFILAILKLGAHYVPLNNGFPIDRLNYICKDAQIKYILSDSSGADKVAFLDEVVPISISIEDLSSFKVQSYNFPPISLSETMAIYYTSGSSGTPKGVEHTCYSILISNYYDSLEFELKKEDIILLFTHWSICFSVTVFAAFLLGSCICIATDMQCNDLLSLDNYVQENGITIVHMPTQVGYQYSQITTSSDVRLLILGGSSFPKLMNPVHFRIVNVYGSTEGMALSYLECNTQHKNSSLGFKCKHCEWIIVDNDYKPVKQGNSGELLICGPSLSKGYLNSPSLNKERYFIYNGKRVFNTKDIVKQEENHSYTYLGRSDKMIKIRGLRIDASEIEDSVLQFGHIKQCCVNTVEFSQSVQLCSYFVSEIKIDTSKLKAFLSRILPEYMVPLFFVQLDALPLTERGKIDYAKLPLPELKNGAMEIPLTEQELFIYKIVQTTLKLENVTLDSSFRDLGGDSLTFLMLYGKIRDMGYVLSDPAKYINIPLYEIAKTITLEKKAKQNTDKCAIKGELSSLSKSILANNAQPVVNQFIIHDFLRSKETLDVNVICQTIEELRKRYPILDCIIDDNGSLSYIESQDSDSKLVCHECNKDDETVKNVINSFFKSFDIHKSLFKILFIHNVDIDYVIIGTHHLISDSISKRILHNEFCKLYCMIKNGETLQISKGNVGIDYLSYRNCLIQLYKSADYSNECLYWQEIKKKLTSKALNFVCTDNTQHKSYKLTSAIIDCSYAQRIIEKSKLCKFGMLTIILRAINEVLGIEDGKENVYQLIRHGRIQYAATGIDVYGALGCFVISHPLILKNGIGLEKIDEILSDIPNEGVGFDVLGGYAESEKPMFGIDFLGDNDFQKIDSEYFDKESRIKGLEPTHPELNMGCPFLMYFLTINGSIQIRVQYDNTLFADQYVSDLIGDIVTCLTCG